MYTITNTVHCIDPGLHPPAAATTSKKALCANWAKYNFLCFLWLQTKIRLKERIQLARASQHHQPHTCLFTPWDKTIEASASSSPQLLCACTPPIPFLLLHLPHLVDSSPPSRTLFQLTACPLPQVSSHSSLSPSSPAPPLPQTLLCSFPLPHPSLSPLLRYPPPP